MFGSMRHLDLSANDRIFAGFGSTFMLYIVPLLTFIRFSIAAFDVPCTRKLVESGGEKVVPSNVVPLFT